MEEQRERQEEEVEYELNEIVWAKIMGFPWWPAKITQLPNHHNPLFRVDFFSDNTHAFLTDSKLNKYQALHPQKDMHRPLRKGLHKAIAAAEEALAELTPPTVTAPAPELPVEANPLQQKQLLQSPSSLTQLQENKLPTVVQQQDSPSQSEQQQSPPQFTTHAQPHPKYSKEQRERFVKNLLKKYRLINIPKTPDQPLTNKFIPKNTLSHRRSNHKRRTVQTKTKRVCKLPHQHHTLTYLLTRKIYTLLNHKYELPHTQRKEISTSLGRQLLGGGGGPDEVNRLFNWLTISHSTTIATYYQNWGSLQASEKEKASNMTTQE